jgi:hypothetical protein
MAGMSVLSLVVPWDFSMAVTLVVTLVDTMAVEKAEKWETLVADWLVVDLVVLKVDW